MAGARYEQERLGASRRGYDSRWRKLRRAHLVQEPTCRYCRAQGRTTAGQVVDHIVPHSGDPALLYDPENLQTLCETCHNAVKQAEERGGGVRGCDKDGLPLDAGHHWKREGVGVGEGGSDF